MYVVAQDRLPFSVIDRELVGENHGGAGISILFVDAPPGRGPGLHRHAYEEVPARASSFPPTPRTGSSTPATPAPADRHPREPAV